MTGPAKRQADAAKAVENARAISRHTLSYMLCAISEMFRYYKRDPIDLLIVHAVLNANVIPVMRDDALDRQFASLDSVEPEAIKNGVSRAALSRFLNLPLETVRRRVNRLVADEILVETPDGLIVTTSGKHEFGNNHHLQRTNLILLRKLLSDLERVGIRGAGDL